MTLHDQVRDPRSTLRTTLTRHAAGVDEWRNEIRDAVSGRPGVVPEETGGSVPWSAVGHAVSTHLIWHVGGDPARPLATTAQRLGPVAEAAVALVSATSPADHDLRAAAALSWWVGQIDRLCRHRPDNDPDVTVFAAARDVDELVAAAPGRCLDDIVSVSEANAAVVVGLSSCGRVDGAPVFTGSSLIGGADADLAVDATLVELKTTIHARPPLRDINQILGYVLLDFDDDYAFTEVGYWSTRFGVLVRSPVERHFPDLAAARSALREELTATKGLSADVLAMLREAGLEP